jgi:hypothetical protein
LRDYYEILMVHEKAIPEVIDRVYRFLARRYHPDVHPAGERQEAERKMLELDLIDDLGAARSLLKCFNHPRRPSVAFCSECGRPICVACVAPTSAQHELRAIFGSGRTVCETCVRRSTDLEVRIRAGRRAQPEGAWYERPMGWWGVALYYLALGLILAGICSAVFWTATVTGATERQGLLIAGIVAGLYVLLVVIRLAWRRTCPNCRVECGRVDFRRLAPWKDFLSPHPACPGCGRHFLKQEVDDSFG